MHAQVCTYIHNHSHTIYTSPRREQWELWGNLQFWFRVLMGLTHCTAYCLLQRMKQLCMKKYLKKKTPPHTLVPCIEFLNITSQQFCLETLLFALASPLYQNRALSTAYHIIPPTKASSAHKASLRAAEENVVCGAAVRPNTFSMQGINVWHHMVWIWLWRQ